MIRAFSIFAATLLIVLVVCGSADEPSAATGEQETNRRTSEWGPVENSLQLRVAAPAEIERGMRLQMKLEFRRQPDKQKPDVTRLNTFLRDEFIELLLTDPVKDKTWIVKPLDPTAGMPPPHDTNQSSVPLDGSKLEPWDVRIPLVALYDELQPGTYTARVRFRFPAQATKFWRGTQADWDRAGFWHGTLVSGPFRLQLKPEIPRTKKLTVPKQLRFRTEQVQLRADHETKTAIPAVYFDKRDAETVEVPIRNGHSLGTWLYRDGEQVTLNGDLLRPNSPNAIDAWYDYKGGDRKATYTIEVFETADHPQHRWHPGPGSAGYKTLWKQTFRVSYSRKEL